MKAFITIVVLLLVGWGVYVWVNKESPAVSNGMPVPGSDTPEMVVAPEAGVTREFTVKGQNFSFSPATIQVNRGDRVKITFENVSGTHDWVIDAFNARTKVLQGGQSETIEFVADQSGSFEYYCSIGSHRQMGMKGTLTVQ